MKVIVLFATFIFINAISPSDSAYCQCSCCIPVEGNPDCALAIVGNKTVDNCLATTDCKQICEQQFPTQCAQNISIASGSCVPDPVSTTTPSVTTVFNGPFECKCSCCSTANCSIVHVGNVIVDKCELCPGKCREEYPSQCGSPTSETNECRPYIPSPNHTYRINYNLFVFLFIFSKHFFL